MKQVEVKNKSIAGITTIISLSLVLFIVGLLAFILINTNKISNEMKEKIVFTIMLSPQDNSDKFYENKKNEFENYLISSNYFKLVNYIDKESSFEKLQKELGTDFSDVLEKNPLLDSYDAYVNAEFVNQNDLMKIESYIKNFKGTNIVQDIFYQKDIVVNLNKNVNKISIFLISFSCILFFIAFALINNTIRLSIYSKRLLIRTMRLVGATNLFIQKPYIITSIYQGIISSILSILLLIISLEIIRKQIPDFIQKNEFQEISIIFFIIFIFGIMISCVSTYFAVRKYLRLGENELYN